MLESPSGPVQYRAATLLRSLCLPGPSALAVARTLASRPGVLPRLVHLASQEDEHVRAEATRTLANMVKLAATPPGQAAAAVTTLTLPQTTAHTLSLAAAAAADDGLGPAPAADPAADPATAAVDVPGLVVAAGAIPRMVALLASPFPALQSEMLVALVRGQARRSRPAPVCALTRAAAARGPRSCWRCRYRWLRVRRSRLRAPQPRRTGLRNRPPRRSCAATPTACCRPRRGRWRWRGRPRKTRLRGPPGHFKLIDFTV